MPNLQEFDKATVLPRVLNPLVTVWVIAVKLSGESPNSDLERASGTYCSEPSLGGFKIRAADHLSYVSKARRGFWPFIFPIAEAPVSRWAFRERAWCRALLRPAYLEMPQPGSFGHPFRLLRSGKGKNRDPLRTQFHSTAPRTPTVPCLGQTAYLA